MVKFMSFLKMIVGLIFFLCNSFVNEGGIDFWFLKLDGLINFG